MSARNCSKSVPTSISRSGDAAYVDADPAQIGLPGSPTKVKAIENVVFTAKDCRVLTDNDAEIEDLVKELITNHTIG